MSYSRYPLLYDDPGCPAPERLLLDAFLSPSGSLHRATIRHRGARWSDLELGEPVGRENVRAYVVPTLPVEFHCHGIGSLDFSEIGALDVEEVNAVARAEGVYCIPTIYLPRDRFDGFLSFMRRFATLRADGKLTHVLGMALEGPLLASFGGTPEHGVWLPHKRQWEALAACGPLGLTYVVLSPDFGLSASRFCRRPGSDDPSLEWIIETLVTNGVRPAFGHFLKKDPVGSAACIDAAVEIAAGCNPTPERVPAITDHLLNDMPVNVRYNWRTPAERALREEQIRAARIEEWTIETLEGTIGPVPARLMSAAHAGRLALCLNFDNEHVDLAIARRVVELVGCGSIIAMTDRTDVPRLGGQSLHHEAGSRLWYQAKGIVAAGSRPIDHQMMNMRAMGLTESDVWTLSSLVAWRVLGKKIEERKMTSDWSYVSRFDSN